MKTALVTGANGFIGKRLVNSLRSLGYVVYTHDYGNGDISQKEALDAYPAVDYVFHLAGLVYVPDSWLHPHDFFRVNVIGTATALEFCREHQSQFIFISTYVYGEPHYNPVDEQHAVSPVSPYHESKLQGERLVRFYADRYALKATILRVFNIFGHGQNDMFLIPKVLNQLLDENTACIKVHDLYPRRDFIYVDDVVRAIVLATKQSANFALYNVGSGQSYSVEEIIIACIQAAGIQKPYMGEQHQRRGEISDCYADITRIWEELGFRPKLSLKDGIGCMISEYIEGKK